MLDHGPSNLYKSPRPGESFHNVHMGFQRDRRSGTAVFTRYYDIASKLVSKSHFQLSFPSVHTRVCFGLMIM